MFKKAATVAFKGETRLRGKEGKKLQTGVATRLAVGEAVVSRLLPSKAELLTRKAGGGSTALFIFADGECVLIQPDGRAEIGAAELFPSLPALWKVGSASCLPVVLIQRPVAKFIFGGANVMAPGIHSVHPADGSDALPKEGALVAVQALGNPSACAVGRLRMKAELLGSRGVKGEAIEVLHYFGDALWEACGSPRPEGFVGDEVEATLRNDEGMPAASEEPAGGAATTEDIPTQAAEASAHHERTATVHAAPAMPESGAQDVAVSAISVDDREEPATPEEMTKAMEECFLQAAKTRIKDKDLPMTGNNLYAQNMRPCRRAGSNIDVKISSCKKLAVFLARLEEHGWLALKKGAADPVVTRIFRDHPDLREWKPWPKSVTAEATECVSGAEASGGYPSVGSGVARLANIDVQSVWRLSKPVLALFESLSLEPPEDGCWTKADCVAVLRAYADRKELWLRNNKKRVGPDSFLEALLGGGSGTQEDQHTSGGAGYSLDGLADNLLSRCSAAHRVAAPQGGAAGGVKRSVRSGRPPVVQVRTDTRRGHSVTLIHGLEAYGMDMDMLVTVLQKTLATSVAVEGASDSTQAGVMVQGFWDVAVVDWLGKVGIPPESIQHQAKKGQQQKKVKQASNIVRH